MSVTFFCISRAREKGNTSQSASVGSPDHQSTMMVLATWRSCSSLKPQVFQRQFCLLWLERRWVPSSVLSVSSYRCSHILAKAGLMSSLVKNLFPFSLFLQRGRKLHSLESVLYVLSICFYFKMQVYSLFWCQRLFGFYMFFHIFIALQTIIV